MIARLEKGQAPTLPTLVRLVRALDAVLTVTAEGLSLRPRGEHASEEPADHGATHNTERKPVSERQYSNPEREAEAVREPDAGYGAVAQGEAS